MDSKTIWIIGGVIVLLMIWAWGKVPGLNAFSITLILISLIAFWIFSNLGNIF